MLYINSMSGIPKEIYKFWRLNKSLKWQFWHVILCNDVNLIKKSEYYLSTIQQHSLAFSTAWVFAVNFSAL